VDEALHDERSLGGKDRKGREHPLQTCQRARKANGVQSPVQLRRVARCPRKKDMEMVLQGDLAILAFFDALGCVFRCS
jgi:hypothetical protein